MPLGPISLNVVIKFIALKIDDKPARCREKIIASICDSLRLSGGYMVQPDLILLWNSLCNKHITDGANNQKEKLFKRGQAMSGVPTIRAIVWKSFAGQKYGFTLNNDKFQLLAGRH